MGRNLVNYSIKVLLQLVLSPSHRSLLLVQECHLIYSSFQLEISVNSESDLAHLKITFVYSTHFSYWFDSINFCNNLYMIKRKGHNLGSVT